MGIKGLTKFLADNAAKAVKQQEFSSLMGRVIAIDASLCLYQFMIAIRDSESFGNLTNEAGNTTSHISGMLSRAVRLLEHGIKPVYVFDGKPPELKAGELAKRTLKKQQAVQDLETAQDAGEMEAVKKYIGRTVRVTKQHNEDVKILLRLMGLPLVEGPCEAEAQCAQMCCDGLVYATATEDADALTFGSNILIRHLNFSEQKSMSKGPPLLVLTLETALQELGLSMTQFVDFCILCGCDYCDNIKGIGAGTAYKLIKQYENLENLLDSLDKSRFTIPDNFPYQQARHFFLNPEVTASEELDLKWNEPDYDGLKKYLVDEQSFNETRVDNYIHRLRKAKDKTSQTRLESFFGGTTVKHSSIAEAKQKAKGKGEKNKSKITAKQQSTGALKRKSLAISTAAADDSEIKKEKSKEVKSEQEGSFKDNDSKPNRGNEYAMGNGSSSFSLLTAAAHSAAMKAKTEFEDNEMADDCQRATKRPKLRI